MREVHAAHRAQQRVVLPVQCAQRGVGGIAPDELDKAVALGGALAVERQAAVRHGAKARKGGAQLRVLRHRLAQVGHVQVPWSGGVRE
jgi:hypothetical protein